MKKFYVAVMLFAALFLLSDMSFGAAISIYPGEPYQVEGATYEGYSDGVFYNDQGYLEIAYSEFLNNTKTGHGGAIFTVKNSTTIIRGVLFDNNTVSGYGGAIENYGLMTIGNRGKFSNNSAQYGGAIENYGELVIGSGTQFDSNTATSSGGAIFAENGSKTTIGSNSSFHSNSAKNGGAIVNHQQMMINDGVNFYFNSAQNGGAIYNTSSLMIGSKSLFSNNNSTNLGGAIANHGEIIIGSYATFVSNESAGGGAIYTDPWSNTTIGSGSLFSLNIADKGGAINTSQDSKMTIGSGTIFTSNIAYGNGGAIINSGITTIGSEASFISNNAARYGGAIYNEANISIASGASFISNSTLNYDGGAIYNVGTMTIGAGTKFISNSAVDWGGAITNSGTITIEDGALFLNNSAQNRGGAIYNEGTLNMTAKTKDVDFTANMANGVQNAIYNASGGMIKLWTKGANIIFNDPITSYYNGYSSEISINYRGKSSGKVILNADMRNYYGYIDIYSGIVEVGPKGTWFENSYTYVENAEISLINDNIDFLNFRNLIVNKELRLSVEADLQNNIMDMVDADNCDGSGKVKVNSIKVLQDSDQKKFLQFAKTYIIGHKIESINRGYSDLYKYNTKYDKHTGLMHFSKKGVNPLRKESGISNIAINNVQKEIAEQVFSRVSGSVLQKQASLNKLYVSADSNRVFNENKLQRGVWLSPYIVKDTMDLGEDVENSAYGTLAGLDWTIGSDKAVTLYCGYNAGKQEYNDVKMNQSGYILGASGIFVKDKLYVGATANVIINNSESENDFGSSETDNKGYSIGIKGGYDIAVGNNWTIEPNMILMYSGVTGSDYTNAQGHEVKDDGINTILIQPGVKGKLSLKNGWQPYGVMKVSINTGENATKVNGIETKDMKLDPYFECGLGLDKEFANTPWSAYAQLTGKAGSRSGFGANLGVKYAF